MSETKAPTDDAAPIADQQRLALLENVLRENPDDIVLKDVGGNFLLCNQTLARLYNTRPEAMVGKYDGDFGVPKKLADNYRENVLDIMASGETEVVFVDRHSAITSEIRHFESIKRPLKDVEGNNQILVISHDITDVVRAQQQVAQSEQRLQAVLTATREGIWDWHVASGRVVHNQQWFRILGFAEGEITGHVDAFSARIHPDDKPLVWQRLRQLLSGEMAFYSSEHRMVCKDGSIIWVLDRGRVAERNAQGEPERVAGTYADIRERKRHELELNQALAQSTTRAKNDFLATVSHELRTPLNGIWGMTRLLQKPNLSESDLHGHARTILRSGQTLLGLLNDLLDLSKVETDKRQLANATPSLPLAAPEARATQSSSSLLQGRLLVAEDHAVNRMVIKALLSSVGLQAEFVDNGHAAVEAVRRSPRFDLTLMDIKMPAMDGQQATRCICQWESDSGAAHPPIIALTAGAFDEDRQRCFDADMDDFLAKPIDRAALRQTLTRWLVGVT